MSPLNATPEQLKGLPPALVITAENDVLRDEGEAYARALSDAGVAARALRVPGMFHGFASMLGFLPQADEAVAEGSRALCDSFKEKN